MASRVWWPGLLIVVRTACNYWNRNKAKLPADLRTDLAPALDLLDSACLILEIYDLGHARGAPSTH